MDTVAALSAPPGGWTLTLGLLAAVSLVALIAALIALRNQRRQLLQDTREIVQAIEEVRAQQPVITTPASTGALSMIGDAVHRLSEALQTVSDEPAGDDDRLQSMVDAAQAMPVITTDHDGDVETFSPGAVALFGWDEVEVVGRPAAVLFEEQSYKDFLPKLARRTLRERGIRARATLLRQDGTQFPGELSVRSIGDPSRGFVILVHEATHLAEVEEDLRDAEERYRNVVDGLPDCLLIVQRGRVVYGNRAFSDLYGALERSLEGIPLRDLVATRDIILLEERLGAVEAGQVDDLDLVAGLVDGEGLPVAEVRIRARRIAYAGLAAVLLSVRDETRGRREAAELRIHEAQLDAVLESSSDGMLVLSAGPEGGHLRMINPAFEAHTETTLASLLGYDRRRLMERLNAGSALARAMASFIGSGEAQGDIRELDADSTERLLQVRAHPLHNRRGEALGLLVVSRDCTERRRTEQELQSFVEKLQLQNVELQHEQDRASQERAAVAEQLSQSAELNEELETLSQMKSNLLGNVVHELQTPLVAIRGYTEMILKERLGPVTDEQHKGLDLALKNIDRLISMIDNLLAFTRQEPEMGRLKLEPFSLRPLVREAMELLAQLARDQQVELHDAVDPTLYVHGDREKILQVFVNLISNGIKFNRPSGRVTISAEELDAERAMVLVEDTGTGIDAERLPKIFDRHYRVDRRDQTGSGIGLSIVRDILRMHGCRIYVDSKPAQGTTFSFHLPLRVLDEEASATTPTTPTTSTTPEAPPGPRLAPGDASANEVQPTLVPEQAPDPGEDPTQPPTTRQQDSHGSHPLQDEDAPQDSQDGQDPGEKEASAKPRFRIIRPRVPRNDPE